MLFIILATNLHTNIFTMCIHKQKSQIEDLFSELGLHKLQQNGQGSSIKIEDQQSLTNNQVTCRPTYFFRFLVLLSFPIACLVALACFGFSMEACCFNACSSLLARGQVKRNQSGLFKVDTLTVPLYN